MYKFRDYIPQNYPVKLIVYVNTDGAKRKINPFINGSDIHTDIMKTQALKLALKKHKFDLAFGGARRDEEKADQKKESFHLEMNHIIGMQKIKGQNYGTYIMG